MDQNPKKKNKKPRRRPRILQRFLDRPRGTTTTSVFSRTVFVMTLLGFVTFAILIAKLFQVQLVDY